MRVPLSEAALNYKQHCGRLEEDQACATCQAQMDHSGSEPHEASLIEREPNKKRKRKARTREPTRRLHAWHGS